jgi:geranylgeranyl diphosphate synthase type I
VTSATPTARLTELSERVGARMEHLLSARTATSPLDRMQAYHLGWRDPSLELLEAPADAGKRLRSALCLLACEALGGSVEGALEVAVAIELVHNFSLVHDDIQDQSPTRRGRPTVWALWGTAQAINVGDALYTRAYLAILASERLAESARLEAARVLAEACLALVMGQHDDLALQGAAIPDLAGYEAMIARKTAALLASSAELGALCAGADESARCAYHELGERLGLAFQYRDDLLGTWGDERVIGKSAAADVRSGKKSLPVVLALQAASAEQAERLGALYALPERDAAASREVLALFDATGARATAERLAAARTQEAREALARAPGSPEGKALIAELIELLARRHA